jgi:tetraacyldisaccharide 4'-kinase
LDLLEQDGIYAELHKNQFKDEISSDRPTAIEENLVHYQQSEQNNQSGFLENSWYQKSNWLFLLWPISLITQYISTRKRKRYLSGALTTWKPEVPIIVVGNVVVGGTGKTPLVIWLAQKLLGMGYKPGIVSRGYGGRAAQYPLLVDSTTSIKDSGDEPYIIAANTLCPVVVSPNRVQAVKKLVSDTDCDVIISDDGMQHYELDRDIEIAVFDGLRGTGNSLCLPAGPLREPLGRIKDVDFIVSSSKSLDDVLIKEDYVMEYKPIEWIRISDKESFEPENWPLARAVHAVAGIGNPSKFFNLLRKLGLQPIEHSFPDHYQFNSDDLNFNDQLPIVMTEKDSVRCLELGVKNIWYLKVEADIQNELVEKIAIKLKEGVPE